ncbi:hypothetical protein HID58_022295 [Brassica napus]|uniref:aminobutyraldehyde dehydrogenase n=1 Tax=Brassica napus TaxID=3708 RepID=A0ABQ8CYU8_BRANA|nr:hypothetical protein HID58_022295 [Brassica napus]
MTCFSLGGKALSLFLMMLKLTELWNGLCLVVSGRMVICSAPSRLLVHEKIADQFLDKLVKWTNNIKISDPFEEGLYRGERVLKFVSNARKGRCNCPLRRSSS